MTEATPNTAQPTGNPARKKALTAVTLLVVLTGLAYLVYWALVLNHYEHTDNAYVQGHVVQLTAQVPGTVVAISADDTDTVKAGQWLVRLDPADARNALDQAEAQLATTVRDVHTLYANNRVQQAQVTMREADVARAQSELARAQDDVNRRQALVASGAVGREEYNHAVAQLSAARSAVAAAQSALLTAREQFAASQALTEGVAADQHPRVLKAAASVREAFLALRRTELPAPIEGQVAHRNVQLGQRVQAGAPLLSMIALDNLWVEANFKESQLQRLRVGQPVELTADVYGKTVQYHGVVDGLGAGTGAAFALLPAQNATGNWIKVVQRVPVRVRLDPAELQAHPLRVGLSMEARVDVAQGQDGAALSADHSDPVAETGVFQSDNAAADKRVREIIARNGKHA